MSGPSDYESLLRQLEELTRRAEEAEKQRQEVEQRAEEDRQRAEEAEKQRQEVEQRASELERRAEQADRKRKEAEQRAEEAEQQAEEAEKSTLLQFLEYCHEYYDKNMKVRSKRKSTTGKTVEVHRRLYPPTIRPWNDFEEMQRETFIRLLHIFHPASQPAPKLFGAKQTVEEMGLAACEDKISSEDALRSYLDLAIQYPVRRIIAALKQLPQEEWDVVEGVEFINHHNSLVIPNAVAGANPESQATLASIRRPRSTTKDDGIDRRHPKDKMAALKITEDDHVAKFVVEHKAPHKVSPRDFKRALENENLCTTVIDRRGYNDDTIIKEREQAEDIVGKVICQTFDYMIGLRVQYGCVSTGQAFAFLWFDHKEPRTLYYHLVVPMEQVKGPSDLFYTAVCQVACFFLKALECEPLDRLWQQNAVNKLPNWPDKDNLLVHDSTADEGEPSVADSDTAYRGPSRSNISSDYQTRSKAKRSCRESGRVITIRDSGDRDSEDDAEDGSHMPSSGAPGNANSSNSQMPLRPAQGGKSSGNSGNRGSGNRGAPARRRQYCTQACLLGLKRGWNLDDKCPNVSSHRVPGETKHPINAKTLAQLIQEQLGRNVTRGCMPLDNKIGARGALFRLVLKPYGYTFVGKGTVSPYIPDLLHEARVYDRLESLQGLVVPVYLGNIDLLNYYFLDSGVYIVHMMLMSWGGEEADEVGVPNVEEEAKRSFAEVCRQGIIHGDERETNMLWNEERQRVMVVDFHLARILPARHKQVLKVLNGKRQREELWNGRASKRVRC